LAVQILTLGDVAFRYVTTDDAAFILQLRSTAVARQTLSSGAMSLDEQKQWLAAYEARHARNLEHYFVICYRKQPVGAVRVYNIHPEAGTFTWGSWAIQPGTHSVVAWITTVLLYDFAFGELGLARATFEVVASNHNVIRFHKSFGAEFGEARGDSVSFTLSKAAFEGIRARFLQRIQLAGP
jgi:RimJ/RimL family protein N-acetyltransferase